MRGKQAVSEPSVSRWILIILNLPTGNSPVRPSLLKDRPMKLGLYLPLGPFFSISFALGDSNSNRESIFYIAKLYLRDMSQQLQTCLIWAQLLWPKKSGGGGRGGGGGGQVNSTLAA